MRFSAVRWVGLVLLLLADSSAGALSPSIQYFDAGAVALSGSGRQVLLSNVKTDQPFSVGVGGSTASGIWDLDNRALELLVEPDGTGLGGVFTDLSADGSTVVGSIRYGRAPTQLTGAYRWRADSGFEILESPASDTGSTRTFSNLRASGDGTHIVGNSSTGLRLFTPNGGSVMRRWNAEGNLEDAIGDPEGTSTYLSTISDDGTRFAGVEHKQVNNQFTTTAIRWTEEGGTETILPAALAAFSSSASALSGDGRVAFGHFRPESPEFTRVFVEDAENGFIDLGHLLPSAFKASLHAASQDGSAAVGDVSYFGRDENARDFPGEAVLWNRAGGTRRLMEILEGLGVDLKGAHLRSAIDLSADGSHILGYTSDGFAFVAIIPEPSPALLIGLGLAGLCVTSNRFKKQRDARSE